MIAYAAMAIITRSYTSQDESLIPFVSGITTRMNFMVWSTIASFSFTILVVLALGWARKYKPAFKGEFRLLALAGVCTAVIVPTTTLMYTYGKVVSVLGAMVIMRGCIIVCGRIVDMIQIRQGLLDKKVSWQENVAAILGIAAVSLGVLWGTEKDGKPPFYTSSEACITLCFYLTAYFIRIYVMNLYRNKTRIAAVRQDSRAYFAVENIFAALSIAVAITVLLAIGQPTNSKALEVYNALHALGSSWQWYLLVAMLGGITFGLAAIPSVFILIFKGKTGTFSTVSNRLTSLVAGSLAAIILSQLGEEEPDAGDWGSLSIAVAAIALLAFQEVRHEPKA